MSFELNVVNNTPLTPLSDIDEVAIIFLNQIGYFSKGYDPKTGATDIRDSVPYRLMVEFFLGRMDTAWLVEDLAVALGTTKATIYRHINKLKGFDLLEEVPVARPDGGSKKGYRLRYGNLSKAWNFTEAHVQVAMENYRKTVDHLQELAGKKGDKHAKKR
ncbi:MAG: helix-turn-helix domain-containing protein [Thermoplasmata archaeon]|jgi:predicted transcriptional regulator|nr:helix-turn-helix domain-containing protein [Thermoplasmata archaeon]